MPTSIYSPASDVTSGWSLFGGGTHASAVLTDDGDSKYIFRNYIAVTTDIWAGVFDIAIALGALITSVTSWFICRTTNTNPVAGGDQISARIRLSGVDYPNIGLTTVNTSYFQTGSAWATNPVTGLPWTAADFDNLQAIGVSKDVSESTVGQVRITKAYLQVDWTLPPLTDAEIKRYWQIDALRRQGFSNAGLDAEWNLYASKLTANNQTPGTRQQHAPGTFDPLRFPDREKDGTPLLPPRRYTR